MIKDIQDLKDVTTKTCAELSSINEEYLSDAGKAALEAYRAINWYACFAESLSDLITNEDYLNLLNIDGKHPEYYRILNSANKTMQSIVY